MSNPLSKHRRLLATLLVSPLLLVAACGDDGDDALVDPSASDAPDMSDQASEAPHADDQDDSDEAQPGDNVVCDLLSEEEVAQATGYEVVAAEGDTTQLPTCEWELSVPAEAADKVGLPMLAIVLMPEVDYRMRTDPIAEMLQDIEGVGDEAQFSYAGGGDTPIPAMASFFAFEGDQGLHILPGFNIWDGEATAKAALTDLAKKVIDRW